jgi:hypothetical protein
MRLASAFDLGEHAFPLRPIDQPSICDDHLNALVLRMSVSGLPSTTVRLEPVRWQWPTAAANAIARPGGEHLGPAPRVGELVGVVGCAGGGDVGEDIDGPVAVMQSGIEVGYGSLGVGAGQDGEAQAVRAGEHEEMSRPAGGLVPLLADHLLVLPGRSAGFG